MGYDWRLLSADANVPRADGVAHCCSTSGFLHLHGGIYTSLLNGLHIAHESDPANFQFVGNLPMDGRHTHNLVALEDRVYSVGGDALGGHKQPQIYSWKESDGSDFRLDLDNVPGLDGALSFAFELNGWLHWGGGQRFAIQGAYGPILTLYRWRPGQNVEQVFARAPYGVRGLFSTVAKHNGKIILPGGAIYEDALPRFHQNDFVSIDAGYSVETINPRTDLAARVWQNCVSFDGKVFLMFGHNGLNGSDGDLADVHVSDDGVDWITGPAFPGVKRHAAAAIPTSSGIIVTTGSHYGRDVWQLFKGAYTIGAPVNASTGWATGVRITCADLFYAIPAGTHVQSIGLYLANPADDIGPKIMRQAPGSYVFDEIFAGPAIDHDGGGYADFPVNQTLPNDGGTYRVTFSHMMPSSPANSFSSSGSRASFIGEAAGNGLTFGFYGDGTICTRWS